MAVIENAEILGCNPTMSRPSLKKTSVGGVTRRADRDADLRDLRRLADITAASSSKT